MSRAISSSPLRRRGTLSEVALRRAIARQSRWCVIDKETGDVLQAPESRAKARAWKKRHAKRMATCIRLVELRVTGERA